MVEHGPRPIKETEEVDREIHVPPQSLEVPTQRKPEHDSEPTSTVDRRKLGKKIIATITGILLLGGGVAFAKLASRETNNLPPRNPEPGASATPFPATGERSLMPTTAEKQPRNYEFNANTRVFAANNVESFMEAQSRFNIDKGVAPSERLALAQFPRLLQNAANINNREVPARELSKTTSQAELIAYNTDSNGLIATMLSTTGIKPGSAAFNLIAKHNELNIKEGTTSQFKLENNKLIAERIKRIENSELGGPVETEEYDVSGGVDLRGETQLWEYGRVDLTKIEK